MRPHAPGEAAAVVELVEEWQQIYLSCLGRRLAYPSDEYYLLAGRPFPPLSSYGAIAQHDNGVGMARMFEAAFLGRGLPEGAGGPSGFFRAVDGAPATGYRAPRAPGLVSLRSRPGAPATVLTGEYGAQVLGPLVSRLGGDAEVVVVRNEFFGGNTAVAGLLTGGDLAAALARLPAGRRYLVPDSCLSGGRFLDGARPEELPRPVEVVPADGASLRRALTGEGRGRRLAGAGEAGGVGGGRAGTGAGAGAGGGRRPVGCGAP
jgi:hypothetical protein